MHVNSRWLRKKAERQELAAVRVGHATYSIHDRQRVANMLRFQHHVAQAVAKKFGRPLPSEGDLELALARHERRYLRFIGAAGKYVPHQGAKERARRLNAA